jgi:hypothetical protein
MEFSSMSKQLQDQGAKNMLKKRAFRGEDNAGSQQIFQTRYDIVKQYIQISINDCLSPQQQQK